MLTEEINVNATRPDEHPPEFGLSVVVVSEPNVMFGEEILVRAREVW